MQNGGPNPSRRPPQWPFLDRKGQNYCTWAMMGLDLQSCRCVLVRLRQLLDLVGPTDDGPQQPCLPLPCGCLRVPPDAPPAAHMHAYVMCSPRPGRQAHVAACGCGASWFSVPGFVAGGSEARVPAA